MMSTINERISLIVEESGLTKTAFAKRVNVSQQYISKLVKTGEPSELFIDVVCREFNVNEEWLRTGEGEMFVALNRTQQIAQFTADLFKGEKDSFKERLLLALSKLDEEEWKVLEKIANDLTREKD